jgi:hypothetical protein
MMLCPTEIIPESHIVEFENHTIDVKVEVFDSFIGFFLYDICELIDPRQASEWKILAPKSPRTECIHQSVIVGWRARIIRTEHLELWNRIGKKLEMTTTSHEWINLPEGS